MNALALVIGNVDYRLEKHKLINAVNDANDFSTKLMALGFTIRKVTNCDQETFERAVTSFGEELKNYNVGLFYFSGHGLQIEGRNYLTAIDTSFADAISAKHTSYPLDQIIDYMQSANPIIKILILDACRDNPLPNQYRGTQQTGLAPIHAPKGTIIAFSTSPGERALDYGAGRNSIYTGSLLNHIDDANIPIEDFFKRVRTSVYTLSQGRQTSWEHTSLIGNFYFNSGQLVHSIQLPYREDCVVDELFKSTGTQIDEIINDLKSHNYYTQKPAVEKLRSINISEVDDSSMFLLGRNILQTAIGGEFSVQDKMRNLGTWLKRFSKGNENHVLNGILYEMYFNSKGHFRNNYFKSEFVDEIYALQTDVRYIESFNLIRELLLPLREHIFYMPNTPPDVLAIEIIVEAYEFMSWDDTPEKGYKLISIKHENVELLHHRGVRHLENEVIFSEFIKQVKGLLCVPSTNLRVSTNIEQRLIKSIVVPWQMVLSGEDLSQQEAPVEY